MHDDQNGSGQTRIIKMNQQEINERIGIIDAEIKAGGDSVVSELLKQLSDDCRGIVLTGIGGDLVKVEFAKVFVKLRDIAYIGFIGKKLKKNMRPYKSDVWSSACCYSDNVSIRILCGNNGRA